jgi:hypothetical protein
LIHVCLFTFLSALAFLGALLIPQHFYIPTAHSLKLNMGRHPALTSNLVGVYWSTGTQKSLQEGVIS